MNREQCKGCAYFIAGNHSNKARAAERFCHHLLLTGERRKRGENDVCLSYSKKRVKATKDFDVPILQF